jgi:flagellar hook-associated protein 1 FlgK
MSLSSLFNTARSALMLYQRGMSVTAQNVANAQTPGYSRRRLEVISSHIGGSGLGTGVTDAGIIRVRDTFLDAAYRRDNGLLGGSETLSSLLGNVEAALQEPSDSGISGALNGLFSAFGDLATEPTSSPNRELVRTAAGRFVGQLHQLDAELTQSVQDATDRLTAGVADVNDLADRIASLNREIMTAAAARQDITGLEDERDVLLDRLSGYASVTVSSNEDGTVSVRAGEATVVEGATARHLAVVTAAEGGSSVASASGGPSIDLQAGSLKSLSHLTTVILPEYRKQLDSFAEAVVTEVNAIHRTGYTLNKRTNVDFFDPAGVSARTISLATDISDSGDAIAAGGSIGSGDNAVALRLAALAHEGVPSLNGKTLRGFYDEFAVSVGSGVSESSISREMHQAMADNADNARMSVSGVSVDEEMVTLISQQEAYGAAARILKVADEMIQYLLQMV